MTCVCGHFHTVQCPRCGCSYYEPDTGDGGKDYSDDYLWDKRHGGTAYHYEASKGIPI